jgi:transposase
MINAFRKHLLREAIEKLFYDAARLWGGCGEVPFAQVFIDGTMLEAQANRHTAV